ncbi:MAG TPA: response regulator, partial [Candidatus Paceibacterota bacterium]|nr:response regulator [Candidatus Paceibacterota bacterium]
MKKILITEDDSLMAEIYRDTFDSAGFSAEIAPDGLIAIQRFQQNQPDVVLLDLMLPKLNGVDVLKFIRTQSGARTIPVIVLSNAYVSELGQQAMKEGATKVLAKNSIGMKALVQEVQRILHEEEISKTVQAAPPNSPGNGNPNEELARVWEQMPQRLVEILRLTQNFTGADPGARLPYLVELYR